MRLISTIVLSVLCALHCNGQAVGGDAADPGIDSAAIREILRETVKEALEISDQDELDEILSKAGSEVAEYRINDHKVITIDFSHYLLSALVLALVDPEDNRIIDKETILAFRPMNIVEFDARFAVEVRRPGAEQCLIVQQHNICRACESLYEIVYAIGDAGFEKLFMLKTREIDRSPYPESPVILRQRSYRVAGDTVYVEETKGHTTSDADAEKALPSEITDTIEYNFRLDSIDQYAESFIIPENNSCQK